MRVKPYTTKAPGVTVIADGTKVVVTYGEREQPASSAPPATPPALGDETGAGGTAPVDQSRHRNNRRGARP